VYVIGIALRNIGVENCWTVSRSAVREGNAAPAKHQRKAGGSAMPSNMLMCPLVDSLRLD
jgi:hypothetical protein